MQHQNRSRFHSHHKTNHRQLGRIRKKQKRLAVALAGAAIMASAVLPGTPAAASPAVPIAPLVTAQQMVSPDKTTLPIQLKTSPHVVAPAAQIAPHAPDAAVTPPAQPVPKPVLDPGASTVAKATTTAPANYKKVLDIKATAYTPAADENGKWGNKTRMGTTVRPGVIAVDPKIIPLGTKVYIQYPDGHGQYAVAEDTGGAIKGNRIDVAVQSKTQAKTFGIKNVKVFVLNGATKA